MIRFVSRSLALVLVPILLAGSTAHAQPADSRGEPATAPLPDAGAVQDREALTVAEQLATDSTQVIEQWITTQGVSEDRLFALLYFPIAKTLPQKYSTPYDALADRDLVAIEDKALARSGAFQYAIVTDVNGYVPAHNSKFSQPLSGKAEQDYVNNRTKRLLADLPSLTAARSTERYLVQRTRLETGDVIYDVSVPITVRGKHWGCVRIGYRRSE